MVFKLRPRRVHLFEGTFLVVEVKSFGFTKIHILGVPIPKSGCTPSSFVPLRFGPGRRASEALALRAAPPASNPGRWRCLGPATRREIRGIEWPHPDCWPSPFGVPFRTAIMFQAAKSGALKQISKIGIVANFTARDMGVWCF